jgi:hypothetical protein
MIVNQYNRLKESVLFNRWKEKNKEYYLCSYVLINDAPQFDFYNPKSDRITSFVLNKKIEIKNDQNIFKKAKDKIKELNINKIKISLYHAIKKINSIEKYKHEEFNKKIIILQNSQCPLWNISLISKTLRILNIKLNAVNGEIISENYESLLNYKVNKK